VVKIFKNFKEVHTLRPGFSAEGIYGGALLAVRSNDFICFYDWNTYQVCYSNSVAVDTPPPYTQPPSSSLCSRVSDELWSQGVGESSPPP